MKEHVHVGAISFLVFCAQFILASAAMKLLASWLTERNETAGASLGAIVA